MLSIFSMFLLAIWMPSLRNVYLDLLHIFYLLVFFFFLILSCMRCLYILEIILFVSRIICKYSLPFSRLSFHFLMVFFALQKVLILIRSHLFSFAFDTINIRDEFKKILLWFMSKRVPCMFSCKTLIVSSLKFRSFIQVYFCMWC